MQILRIACATLAAALLSFVVAQSARGQCSYLALEVFYTVPVAGVPNVMDACAKGTGGFQIVNVSAASNAYPASNSQLTSNQDSTSEIEVTFEGTNQHLMQSYFINGRWAAVDLSAVTGGTLPVVGSAMTSFADGYGQHVFYIGTDNVVHQMLNSNGSWRSLSAGGSVNPNGSQLTNYVIKSQET